MSEDAGRLMVLHVADDRERAAELGLELRRSGFEVDVHPGEAEGLDVALLDSAFETHCRFVVCMSRAAAGDAGFEGLLRPAIYDKLSTGERGRLFVAKLDPRAKVPALLRDERHADCSRSIEAGARGILEALDAGRRAAPDPELDAYLRCLRATSDSLPVRGIPGNIQIPLTLDQVFVPLRAMAQRTVWEHDHMEPGAARGLDRLCGVDPETDVPLDRAFRVAGKQGMRGLVVLGEPGSGKTTLLKHFVLVLTDPARGPRSLGLPGDAVPVLVTLRRVPEAPSGLLEALVGAVERPELGTDPGFARRLLKRKNLVLLIDGLDEVPSAGAQAKVSAWIAELATERPDIRVVLTSRYPGYRGEARLDGRFLELHIRGLTEPEARRYVERWQSAVERAVHPEHPEPTVTAAAAAQAEDLLGKVFGPDDRSKALGRLTENPLLLHILCLVHREGGTLPEARSDLYARCVDVLLASWRAAKKLPLRVPRARALDLLQPMAWWLHQERKRTEAPLCDVRAALDRASAEAGRPPEDVTALLEAVRDDSGLVVDLGQQRFGFLHLTFQEYLCALHVQSTALERPEILDELVGHFGEEWWEEVLLLAVSLDSPPLFEPLARRLVRLPQLTQHPGWLDDVLRDAGRRAPRPFLAELKAGIDEPRARYEALRAVKVLLAGKEPTNSDVETLRGLAGAETDEQVRGLLGELLGHGRPVASGGAVAAGTERVHDKDGCVLVYVPGGEYVIGDDRLSEWCRPAHRVLLSPFWIGKYPVTNAQYERFLAARPSHKRSKYLDDKRFGGPDQPVVGVNWNDAVAYAAWAGLVLPSEAQWEAAARGPGGRRYPWGEATPTAKHANFDSKVGRTSPVGTYPAGAGPFGTLDQAGNVWEWCRDQWKEDAYAERKDGERNPECATGDASARPLRGGSWVDQADSLAAADRDRLRADYRDRDIGFRVVCPARPEP